MYEDEISRFKRYHGYEPNLKNPKTFNEKVVVKKLFNRNPLLTLTADKYRARNYIRQKIDWEAENHLIPLVWVGKNPEKIPWNDLLMSYIIKPNNGAGRWLLVENKCNPPGQVFSNGKKSPLYNMPIKERINIIKNWFKTIHGQEWYEWCYQGIDPLIVIEKLIQHKGCLAWDYKFWMFGGKCKLIYVLDRNDVNMTFYDENWKLLPVKRKGHPTGTKVDKPKYFDIMIRYAEKLSNPFDFVRIDFYVADTTFYFGEITHYPASGHGVFEPSDFDKELGKYWKIGDYI